MTKRTRYFMAGSAAVLAAGLGTGLIAYYTGGFQPVSASAVANELRYMPADTKLMAYVDVRAIMDSELRARLKEALPMPEHGQKEFQEQTGIDIERDIDYVVAALATDAGAGQAARRGPGPVQRYPARRPHPRSTAGRSRTTRASGWWWRRQANTGTTRRIATDHIVLAFLEPGLVAFGDGTAVRTAIDAQLTSHSITSNNEMMDLVTDIGRNNNAWAVGRFDILAAQAKLPEQIARQLPAVKWFAAAGHVNGGVSGTLRAEARDDAAAENLRDVVRGFLALARMQAQADPRAAGLIDSLQLTGSGKTVALSFSVPAEILDMIPKAGGRRIGEAGGGGSGRPVASASSSFPPRQKGR